MAIALCAIGMVVAQVNAMVERSRPQSQTRDFFNSLLGSIINWRATNKTMKTENLKLSIIIPTLERSTILAKTIDDVLSQNFKDFEFWIVDQSSAREAAANASHVAQRSDPRLKYLHLAKAGLPNARNEGIRRAKGEIILFLDDDVMLSSADFLTAHLAAYSDPRVGGVTGRHVERSVVTNCKHTACYVSWGGRTIYNLRGHQRQLIGSCKGSNMSFRAEVVEKVGGFDRNTDLLEDTDFSVRVAKAGWSLLFEPTAEIVHLSAISGGVREIGVVINEHRRFSSTAYYIRKHRGFLGCIPFVATFSLIALSRAWRYRSLGVLPGCAKALRSGFALAKRGPDQIV
jgi:GT2 family glycosyltransferase